MSALELIGCALCVLGTLTITLAVVGTFRWRGLAMRTHAAAKSALLGVVALLAASVGTGDGELVRRALLVALVLLLTTPVSAHVILQAAWRHGGRDELDPEEG